MQNHINKESTKKYLINEILRSLLGIEFKSNHSMKSNLLKKIVEHLLLYCLHYYENEIKNLLLREHTDNVGLKKSL